MLAFNERLHGPFPFPDVDTAKSTPSNKHQAHIDLRGKQLAVSLWSKAYPYLYLLIRYLKDFPKQSVCVACAACAVHFVLPVFIMIIIHHYHHHHHEEQRKVTNSRSPVLFGFFELLHDAQISTYLLRIPSKMQRDLSDTYVSRDRCRGQVAGYLTVSNNVTASPSGLIRGPYRLALITTTEGNRKQNVSSSPRFERALEYRCQLLFTMWCNLNSLFCLSKFAKF